MKFDFLNLQGTFFLSVRSNNECVVRLTITMFTEMIPKEKITSVCPYFLGVL